MGAFFDNAQIVVITDDGADGTTLVIEVDLVAVVDGGGPALGEDVVAPRGRTYGRGGDDQHHCLVKSHV